MEHKASIWAATTALLAATAIVISMLRLRFPYPLLPFLSFDLSEIPSVLAFLILDLRAGALVALVHWLTLNLGRPYHAVIGPLMKLIAVLSMLLGFWIASRFVGKISNTSKKSLLLFVVSGILTRVGIMSPIVFSLYYIFFPGSYLGFASKIVERIFGWSFSSELDLTLFIVGLTALFNLLHVPLSFLPASAIQEVYRKITGRT